MDLVGHVKELEPYPEPTGEQLKGLKEKSTIVRFIWVKIDWEWDWGRLDKTRDREARADCSNGLWDRKGEDKYMNYFHGKTKVNDRMWKYKNGVEDESKVSDLCNYVDNRAIN